MIQPIGATYCRLASVSSAQRRLRSQRRFERSVETCKRHRALKRAHATTNNEQQLFNNATRNTFLFNARHRCLQETAYRTEQTSLDRQRLSTLGRRGERLERSATARHFRPFASCFFAIYL